MPLFLVIDLPYLLPHSEVNYGNRILADNSLSAVTTWGAKNLVEGATRVVSVYGTDGLAQLVRVSHHKGFTISEAHHDKKLCRGFHPRTPRVPHG